MIIKPQSQISDFIHGFYLDLVYFVSVEVVILMFSYAGFGDIYVLAFGGIKGKFPIFTPIREVV